MLAAASLGGDSDTVAAMVGAMAGARPREQLPELVAQRCPGVVRFGLERHPEDADRHALEREVERAALLGRSVAVGISGGELSLGRFQSILFAELDGPRPRSIDIQIMGVGPVGGE